MKQNVFRSRQNEAVDRSSFSSVGRLFHARGAATEKALLPITSSGCQLCVCGSTKSNPVTDVVHTPLQWSSSSFYVAFHWATKCGNVQWVQVAAKSLLASSD